MRTSLIFGPRAVAPPQFPVSGTAGAVFDRRPGSAAAILRPGVDLWAWRRGLPEVLAHHAEALAADRPRTVRAALDADGDGDRVERLIAERWPAAVPGRRMLAADAASLARLLAETVGVRRVTVRVQVSRGAACPLFHVDAMTVRLLCTYAGPGTEWLGAGDGDRSELGLRRRPLARANAAIAPDPGRIRRLPAGWVALLKGDRARPSGGGLIHRSPDSDEPRLVLVVDPIHEEHA